jgi:hypothetical protein
VIADATNHLSIAKGHRVQISNPANVELSHTVQGLHEYLGSTLDTSKALRHALGRSTQMTADATARKLSYFDALEVQTRGLEHVHRVWEGERQIAKSLLEDALGRSESGGVGVRRGWSLDKVFERPIVQVFVCQCIDM